MRPWTPEISKTQPYNPIHLVLRQGLYFKLDTINSPYRYTTEGDHTKKIYPCNLIYYNFFIFISNDVFFGIHLFYMMSDYCGRFQMDIFNVLSLIEV